MLCINVYLDVFDSNSDLSIVEQDLFVELHISSIKKMSELYFVRFREELYDP